MGQLFEYAVGGLLFLPLVGICWGVLKWAEEERPKAFGWIAYGLSIAGYLLSKGGN